MAAHEWIIWAIILFLQQATYLFSGRAKASGSLVYSGIAGLFSHSTWFFANLYFVQSIFQFKDSPWHVKAAVCAFYVTFTLSGTLTSQWAALRWVERGKMKVGER